MNRPQHRRPPHHRNQGTASATLKPALKPALMAGAMVSLALCLPLLGGGHAQSTLVDLVSQGGLRGPVLYLAVATLLTAIGLPRQIPAFVAGYAFGTWSGTAIALLSQMLACGLDFMWARALGREFVTRKFGTMLRRIDKTLAAQPFIATLTFRLMPVGSNILLNFAAGLSSVRAFPFLAASLVGFIPQTVIFALIGRGSAPSHANILAMGLATFALSAVLGAFLLRKHRQISA
ncbi:MAG: VTT domain-containing protein [Acidocella sp.]|nr:VTT domain-containing protein [Acidocella sp.]